MEDKELLEKIIAKQSVIIPAMEKTGETKDIPEKLSLIHILQLNEDGSAVLSVLGTNMDGSWTAKDATTCLLYTSRCV